MKSKSLLLLILTAFIPGQFAFAESCKISIESAFDCSGAPPCAITLYSEKKVQDDSSLNECIEKAVALRKEIAADKYLNGVKAVVKYKGQEGKVNATIRK
jgi:hypothetical protein